MRLSDATRRPTQAPPRRYRCRPARAARELAGGRAQYGVCAMPRPTTFRLSDGTLEVLDGLCEQLTALDYDLLHHGLPEDVRGAYTRTEAVTIAIHRAALNMREPRAAEAYWRTVAERHERQSSATQPSPGKSGPRSPGR